MYLNGQLQKELKYDDNFPSVCQKAALQFDGNANLKNVKRKLENSKTNLSGVKYFKGQSQDELSNDASFMSTCESRLDRN